MSARSRKQKNAESEKAEASTPPSSGSQSRSSLTIERTRVSTATPHSFSRTERSHSPLSISRSDEKDELAHLNDRLAGYIDYVRKLELDKERLTSRIHTITEERVETQKLVKSTVHIEEEITDRQRAEYESRLADELRDIRQQTAIELDEYKLQLEETFENRFGHLRSSADHSAEDASRQRSELLSERKRLEELSHELSKKVAELELLQRRVDDFQRQLDLERRDHDSQMQFQRQEVQRLKRELEESFREFTELMNTKIALDQEILMYRKMLEGEESRLNLQSPTKDSPFNFQPGKRRRMNDDGTEEYEVLEHSQLTGTAITPSRSQRYAYTVSATNFGGMKFFDTQDSQGKWVKIVNSSKEVWSADAETAHNPPSDIVMRGKSFHSAPEATMTLFDGEGKVRPR